MSNRVAYAYAWADKKTGKLDLSSMSMLGHPPKGHVSLFTREYARLCDYPNHKLVRVKVTYEIVG